MPQKIHDEPSLVAADDGHVAITGPDSVDVWLTADAAEETSHRLLTGAMTARGQIYLAGRPPAVKP